MTIFAFFLLFFQTWPGNTLETKFTGVSVDLFLAQLEMSSKNHTSYFQKAMSLNFSSEKM